MNSVQKVKALCKERKVPVSRLEKELGFANGYIGQLKKGTFPYDRLILIANYFKVPVDTLADDDACSPILVAFSGGAALHGVSVPASDATIIEITRVYDDLSFSSRQRLLNYARRLSEYDIASRSVAEAEDALNAAHVRTDVSISEEDKKHDDDIMDDSNF